MVLLWESILAVIGIAFLVVVGMAAVLLALTVIDMWKDRFHG